MNMLTNGKNGAPTGAEAQFELVEVIPSSGAGHAIGRLAAEAARLNGEARLGNSELPVAGYRDQIIQEVADNQVVVLTAETGAGKSTQVPQFLMEAGYDVVMTQPRQLATQSVAERIGDEVKSVLGQNGKSLVGWQTRDKKTTTADTRISVVTDGLELARMTSGDQPKNKKRVLVLDEVHEWNQNQEVLVALAKQEMRRDPSFKVVLMSATLEAERLADFFTDGKAKRPPILDVPGRTFGVSESVGGDLVQETAKLARAGKNTLVFVPGKAEIEATIAALEKQNLDGATILRLHGQLSAEDQAKVFKKYGGAKIIVSTGIAQTSVTIDDIDAVVDSGLERRTEVRNGVEGLYLGPISQADCRQRKGRAGRTRPGEYVLAQLDASSGPVTPIAERTAFPVPEINRTLLNKTVLGLAKMGLDAAELEFFHQPDKSETQNAKDTLRRLGALDAEGKITTVGREMEQLPVGTRYARMMVEAAKYSRNVQAQMAAIVAAQESGGLINYRSETGQSWRTLTAETTSDSLQQLDLYIATQNMSPLAIESSDLGLSPKGISRARRTYKQLSRDIGISNGRETEIPVPTAQEREQLVRSIIAGLADRVYAGNPYGYTNPHDTNGTRRTLRSISQRTAITEGAAMFVAEPFDLETKSGRKLSMLTNLTRVPSFDVLREVAPQLVEIRKTKIPNPDGSDHDGYGIFFNDQYMGESSEAPVLPAPTKLQPVAKERPAPVPAEVAAKPVVSPTPPLTTRPLPVAPAAVVNKPKSSQELAASKYPDLEKIRSALSISPNYTEYIQRIRLIEGEIDRVQAAAKTPSQKSRAAWVTRGMIKNLAKDTGMEI